jgi:iron complex outermembrane receptor protein
VGAGVRYSGRQYGTLDNTDVLPNVYGGTSRFFTVDLKASYRIDKHFTVALGVDNLTDRRDFVYHPYPSRTFYGQLKWRL